MRTWAGSEVPGTRAGTAWSGSWSRAVLAVLAVAVLASLGFSSPAEAALPPVVVSQVKDIEPGAGDGDPINAVYTDDRLRGVRIDDAFIFTADGPEGIELWRSDGTNAGTELVKDIAVGASFSSIPKYLTEFNGEVFFAANVPPIQNLAAEELWKTDGTEAGTVMVKDINPTAFENSSPNNLVDVNGTLFFMANSDAANGFELWKSDGTEAGTVMVKDIGSSVATPAANFNAVGSRLFFTFDDNGASGKELWTSDGTPAGTKMVEEIGPGPADGITGPAELPSSDFISFDGDLFFRANDGTNGEELWRSDGTEAGTYMVEDLSCGGSPSCVDFNPYFTVRGGELFFASIFNLAKTDGTEAGTGLVATAPDPSDPMATVGDTVFYPDGPSLYKTDGTGPGTEEVKDFGGVAEVRDLTDFNGTLYFTADDGVHGRELWRSDGTLAGTERLTDINPGGDSLAAARLSVVGDHLYFRGDDDGATGVELWQAYSDVTPPETTIDSGPGEGETIETDSATFTFSSNEAGASFDCTLDAGPPEECDSGSATFTGLAEGPHEFSVSATDPAPFSNVDPTPATRTFTVDTTAPDTTIDSGPSGTITTDQATFTFSGDPASDTAKIQCRIDAGDFADCTSPKTFTGLSDGPHTATFRAEDAAGNQDATPATRTFTVDTSVDPPVVDPPVLDPPVVDPPVDPPVGEAEIGKVKVKGPAKVKRKKKATYKVKIKNSGNAAATGVKLKVKGKGIKSKKSVGKIAAGKAKTVKVKLKFKKSGKIKVAFKVTSKNAGGKTVKKTIRVRK